MRDFEDELHFIAAGELPPARDDFSGGGAVDEIDAVYLGRNLRDQKKVTEAGRIDIRGDSAEILVGSGRNVAEHDVIA